MGSNCGWPESKNNHVISTLYILAPTIRVIHTCPRLVNSVISLGVQNDVTTDILFWCKLKYDTTFNLSKYVFIWLNGKVKVNFHFKIKYEIQAFETTIYKIRICCLRLGISKLHLKEAFGDILPILK